MIVFVNVNVLMILEVGFPESWITTARKNTEETLRHCSELLLLSLMMMIFNRHTLRISLGKI